MRRYHFSGHLNPTPPGMQPFQMGGHVYLASEADALFEEMRRKHASEAFNLNRKIRKLEADLKAKKKELRELKKPPCPTCLPERVCSKHG